jgi:hypothetical protein
MSDVAPAGAIERPGHHGLVALCNPYKLDGRVSTHPIDVRGWAPMNVYVLREGDHVMVIDSGLTVHRDAVLDQLATLVDERTLLTLVPYRQGELNSMCNFGPIAERFGAARILGDYFGPAYEWMDFLPGSPGVAALEKAAVERFATTGSVRVDPDADRALECFVAPIWLLPYPWIYDAATRTLFTPDVFAWATRPTADGPWAIGEEDDDETTVEDVWHALTTNMYWWLPGARIEGMRRDIADVFDRYDVETIAPGYGCLLSGRRVVERHVQMLDDVLVRAAAAESHGVAVGTWRQDKERA